MCRRLAADRARAETARARERVAALGTGAPVADARVWTLVTIICLENELAAEAREALGGLAGVTAVESDGNGTAPWIVEAPLDRDLRRDINERARARGWDLLELHPQEPTLEEAFIALTDHGGVQ